MLLRRLADALERPAKGRPGRAVLQVAATDFLTQLQPRAQRDVARDYPGWELSDLARPAFWSCLLLSQRRDEFALRLLREVHPVPATAQRYVEEKRATQEILDAIAAIDVESLLGFADLAVQRFQPAGSAAAAPVVPRASALEILEAALLRGAMVGELRPEAVEGAWLGSHPEASEEPDRHWKMAQGRAESLYSGWQATRQGRKRRIL